MKDLSIKIKKPVIKCYKVRLYEHEIQKRDEENQKEIKVKQIYWGHQIRSYVLSTISTCKRFKK